MSQYNKYLISPGLQFDPKNYSSVNEEIQLINEGMQGFPTAFRAEIIVSFLKDHSLQTDWIKANPELTKLVTSGGFFKGSIESLFESSRINPGFRADLENYLMSRFTKGIAQ